MKTTGVSSIPKFRLLDFLGHPSTGVGYALHRGVFIHKSYNPAKNITKQLRTSENSWEHRKTPKIIWYHPENNWGPLIENLVQFEEDFNSAQCAVCKVRCHCIFYGPGIRYSDIFGAPGIRYSVIIKLPCALLQTGHLETVHAPVVDTVTYFGGNHRSRVWKSLKLKKVFFPRTRTSWDKYMFNRIVFLKI